MGDDRAAELAGADEGDVLAAGAVEKAADALDALVDFVAARGAARVADRHEVAAYLGLQKSAASNRYIRALKRLKTILAACSGPESEERSS